MEHILINHIQNFLNDNDFLRCLSCLCKNIHLKNRIKQISKKRSNKKLNNILQYFKIVLLNDNLEYKINSDFNNKNGRTNLYSSLVYEFLRGTFISLKYNKKIIFRTKYVRSENFMKINKKPVKKDFNSRQIISNDYIGNFDTIYRMKKCFVKILKKDYSNVKALIY